MATADAGTGARTPLSREKVLVAAIAVADDGGLDALTMRGVAAALDVEAMSLYHHVANKDAMLDGIVEQLMREVIDQAGPVPDLADPAEWRSVLRDRILAARSVLVRHPWAPAVLESRQSPGPSMIAWFDQVIGIMVAGGMSYDLVHHAMHALGSRVLGFVQELFVEDEGGGDDFEQMMEEMAEVFPNMVGMLSSIAHDGPADETLGSCDDRVEFEFGLDLLLDGLEAHRLA